MEGARQQKSVVLILARELAANVATPIFLIDKDGKLVFYNEPAEAIVGQPFAQVGEMPVADWGASMQPEDAEGNKLSRRAIPPGVAFLEQRAAHQEIFITGADGVRRGIEITAFPLFAKADEFAGAICIFWERGARESSAEATG
ncbi:MAG: PAS domain-containing protein [Actinobacteria bacterium]|nr:PAS domain-containing protein [Actinomycetota bacterium]MBV8959194.1 PAS domain-containing protein [Actinomycetota bacterium]MBV9253633.1 PAS domain-containing protein [Actinomycetota bacterium]